MARSGKGRGTRMGKGNLSGTTVQTSPSGVTLAAGGIYYDGTTPVTPTEIGRLDGIGGAAMSVTTAGRKMSGGSITWGGASLGISTGLTTVIFFNASQGRVSGASASASEWVHAGGDAGIVTAALVGSDAVGARQLIPSGGSLMWMAFGT